MMLLAIFVLCQAACGEPNVKPFRIFEFYDNAGEWVKEDFRSENLLSGSSDIDSENELPQTRTFIVLDREMFDEMFVDKIDELNIGFDSEMILVYTFTSIYVAPANITKIAMDDSITFTYQFQRKEGTGSATAPFQRWFVVVIDREDYASHVFEEKLN